MASPRIKLLTCLTTLALLIGCVPSFVTPTPIPPLDPNAIGTFTVQTADAAVTQTMAALPPSTPTATITATPRNTFTPEPSFTPVQPYLFPTATGVLGLQYYRVKHDNQLAIYNYKSRTHDDNSEGMRNQAPEVVPLLVSPKEGTGTHRTTVDGAWETYIDALNDNDKSKLKYLKSPITALFNRAGFPQLESLTMGGNIITLNEIQGTWGRVNTLEPGGPPSVKDVNWITRPDLVHKFVVVTWKRSTKTTALTRPPKGDIYWPLVTKQPVWIQMDRLEPFPILPMEVTANLDLYIQDKPGPAIEETRFQLLKGESASVVLYYPSGSDVWGRLSNGGWIPLLYRGQYRTTWSMATVPPP
ncbi:MAG: hypothetical protein JW730_21715 [Anaerolineales bacterium]|nr:hypothetical protein [Anaerolineales bacterium]